MNNNKLLCKNLTIENNELYFAGLSVKDLAKKYGTPLYLMDEDLIREKINIYKKAINDGFNGKGRVLYASKACSFKHIYEIAKDENIGIDVVSPGEIWTAKSAGFDLSNAFYHSNNKTDEDIKFAIDQKVGYFVIDNEEELYSLDKIVKEKNIKQKVLIRITPGIDCHTLEAISTGKVDSKFGFGIETGLAFDIVEKCQTVRKVFDCNALRVGDGGEVEPLIRLQHVGAEEVDPLRLLLRDGDAHLRRTADQSLPVDHFPSPFCFLRLASHTLSTCRSAGFTPLIRAALPKEAGRTLSSLSAASSRSPAICR